MPRRQARTIVVTSAADSGPGSLRQALLDAQSGDKIAFDPAVFPLDDPTTISVLAGLPQLTQGGIIIDASDTGVILDGSRLPRGQATIGLEIVSNGNVIAGLQILSFPDHGIQIASGASDNLIGGSNPTPDVACSGDCNLIGGNLDGVHVSGAGTDRNRVSGNYIGTDATGTRAMGNAGMGVAVTDGAHDNQVGGDTSGERNLISGNGEDGVHISGGGTLRNLVRGNFIGTNAAGTAAIPNGNIGVNLGNGTQHNRIGSDTVPERNVVSGNANYGVHIAGEGVMHNVVIGNYIGTDATGTQAIGNAVHGVAFGAGAQHNHVGGETPEERNVISGNGDGVRIDTAGTMDNTVVGNYIGVDVTGTGPLGNDRYGVTIYAGAGPNIIGPGNIIAYNGLAGVHVQSQGALGNSVVGNAIFANGGPGIQNLEGGNTELPPPEIAHITSRSIEGSAPPNATIEVFSDQEDGQIAEGTAVADAEGNFRFSLPAGTFSGPQVTATATDPQGNTSQFSAAQSPPAPVVTRELPGIVGPRQVAVEPEVVGTNLGLALFCALFFGFSSTVFNAILKDYRDELTRAFGRLVPRRLSEALKKVGLFVRRATERGRGGFLVAWLMVLLLTALIESFLDPAVGVTDPQRLGIWVTLLASAVVVSALELGSDVLLHRRWSPGARLESKVQWVGIGVAVACVVLSRALGFKPGYLYGIVGAAYLAPRLAGVAASGKRAVLVLLTVFVGSLILWGATAFLPAALAELEPILLTTFLIGLQGVFFQLVPLAITDGGDIWSWKKGLWFAFFAVVFFCFYHFALNPNGSDIQALQQNGVQTLLVLIGAYGLATLALWLLLPFRLARRKAVRS
jgi:hypothetical protein